MSYDFLAEVSRRFQETHVQQNGETPAETIARAEQHERLRPNFKANSERLLAEKLAKKPEVVRQDKVAAARAKIEAGEYNSLVVIDETVARLHEDLLAS